MKTLTFEEYKIKQTQIVLVNSILKTAKFKTMEEFIKIDEYCQNLKIDCVEFERQQAATVNRLYGYKSNQ